MSHALLLARKVIEILNSFKVQMFDHSCFVPAKPCFIWKLMFENTTTCRGLGEIAITTWKREERETPPVPTSEPRKVAGVARFLLQNYIPGKRLSGHDPFSGFGINCSWLQIVIVASAIILHIPRLNIVLTYYELSYFLQLFVTVWHWDR